jgi:hypothetical protein
LITYCNSSLGDENMKTKILITTMFLLAVFGMGQVYAACIGEPVGYWTLDQDGSPYSDSNEMGGGLDGTCTPPGCPVADASGLVGSSQVFDGDDDGISFADNGLSIFDRGTTDSFSIAAWFRRDAGSAWSNNEVLVGRYVNAPGNRVHFWMGLADSTGNAYFRLWDDNVFGDISTGFISGSVNLADGQWHHMVAVRDGQTNQNFLYVDGVQVGLLPLTYSGDFTADGAPVTIGRMNNNYYFNGNIDEVAFFDVALPADTVTEMFEAGNNGTSICTDNRPPTITSQAPTDATVGEEYVYNPTAEDPDGDTLTWSLNTKPTDMVINETNGTITWTPPAGTTTSDLITLVVEDGFGGTASQDFTITVGDGTDPTPPGSDGDSSGGGGCFINAIIP